MLKVASKATLSGAALAASLVVISLLASCGGGGSDSTQAGTGSGSIESFGEEASPGDRAAMTKVVQEFLRARAEGDWAKACSLIAPPMVENLRKLVSQSPQLKDRSCPELVKPVIATIPAKTIAAGKRIRVTGARIEGDHGFVLYRDARGTSSAFPVAREGSIWKVGALVGPSLP